jgi:uncharacterized protein (DUF486 family)
MKIYSNDKLIKRNKFLSRLTLILGLGFMGFAFFTLLNSETNSPLFTPSLISGAIGIILATINIPLSARFGVSPRPDELINSALKGLDNSYALFHYTTPIPHILAGPTGIWLVNTFMVQGRVIFDAKKKKWKLYKSGGFFAKLFGTESIGNPTLESEATVHDFEKLLKNLGDIPFLPEPKPLALFISKDITLETEESPLPAVSLEKLKAFVRKNPELTEIQKNAIYELSGKLGQ